MPMPLYHPPFPAGRYGPHCSKSSAPVSAKTRTIASCLQNTCAFAGGFSCCSRGASAARGTAGYSICGVFYRVHLPGRSGLANLVSIAVAPEARGGGAASSLLTSTIRRLKLRGVERLTLHGSRIECRALQFLRTPRLHRRAALAAVLRGRRRGSADARGFDSPIHYSCRILKAVVRLLAYFRSRDRRRRLANVAAAARRFAACDRAGLFLWTLLEYGIHRFAFHGFLAALPAPRRSEGSEIHRLAALAFLRNLAAALGGDARPRRFWARSGLTLAGIISRAILLYEAVHLRIHANEAGGPLLRALRKRHYYHHFADDHFHYGVTTLGLGPRVWQPAIARRWRSPAPMVR